MPVDSIKNIERAFTGRIPLVTLDNDTLINQVVTLIDYAEVLNRVKPSTAINVSLSVALEQLQLTTYLPGLYRPYRLPEYDEDLTPLIKRQAEDLEWMAEFNPTTGNAIEITLFEKFNNTSWQAIARKWLYNQQVEYYLDLINPFLNSNKASDIGDSSYSLGVAITQKPTSQTVNEVNNYIRIRGAYSGIVTYEQNLSPKKLSRNAGSQILTTNSSSQILAYREKRKVLYLQNTGNCIVYYNFGDSIGTPENCFFLLPNESLSYEGDKISKDLPLIDYLIAESLHVYTEGKNEVGELSDKRKVSFIEFYEV